MPRSVSASFPRHVGFPVSHWTRVPPTVRKAAPALSPVSMKTNPEIDSRPAGSGERGRSPRGPVLVSLLASVALNLLVLFVLIFVTVGERPPAPPAIAVTSVVKPPEERIEAPKLDRPAVAATRIGGSAPLPVLSVTAGASSHFTMAVPDLPAFDPGLSGLAGIGPDFGGGTSLGGGFDGVDPGGSVGQMKVGKITVKAKALGVVLDVSGSMQEKLPEVKKELRRAFHSAKIVEVEGCGLHWNKPEEPPKEKVRLRSSADSVLEAVEMLVVDGKVDALYWFSDLQDGESEAGLERLSELLSLKKGKGRAVRFYVRSLEREPSRRLATIVRASGGAVQAGEKGE